MRIKFLVIMVLLFVTSQTVSAVLLSDQGTSVRNLTGSLLERGNLTILIYSQSTTGDIIFNLTTQDSIINGSWNLMINPSLEYGLSYWKDYEINGEDLDFDGNERIEFQSGLGPINNISFINFSMINSCPIGSSIRLIYSNGSVECQSSSNGSSGADLINYALKNQSEIFAGNITTSHTGFFGFLGNLANRITKLFVTDIDASGNINSTGNVTASYFKGDGSLLTNLATGTEVDPIFVSENLTLWGRINSKLAQTDQRYNDTVLVLSINTTSNFMSLGFYNSSQIDSLISEISNSSFNQSLTDNLYYSINNLLNFINHTQASIYNDTATVLIVNSSLWDYIDLNQANWISTFNITYAGLINNASYLSTYNNTYDSILNQHCQGGQFVNGTLSNGTLRCSSLTQNENLFNQWLNTSSNVTFANLTISSNSAFANNLSASSGFFGFLGSALTRITKLFVVDLDVSNNLTVSENISAQFYFGSLNRSTFPTSACSGTNKVVSILANGMVNCGTDETSGGSSGTSFNNFNITLSDVSTTDNGVYTEFLTLPLSSGQNIMIECILLQDAAAAGTGVQYNSVLSGTSSQRQVMEYYSSATAQAICSGTSTTLTCSPSSSSGTTVTPNKLYVYAVTSSAGTFTLNVKSEVSGSAAIVRAGSWCRSIES